MEHLTLLKDQTLGNAAISRGSRPSSVQVVQHNRFENLHQSSHQFMCLFNKLKEHQCYIWQWLHARWWRSNSKIHVFPTLTLSCVPIEVREKLPSGSNAVWQWTDGDPRVAWYQGRGFLSNWVGQEKFPGGRNFQPEIQRTIRAL